MISLTVFFYAASRHHNDVILMPAICSASGNNFVFQQSQRTVYRHTTPCTCNSWTAASRNAKRFWAQSPNSPDLSPVDWAVMQHRVYHRQIHRVDELKRRLIDVWCSLEQSILTRLLTSSEEDIELKEGISSTACELAMLILSISVTFNVTCSTVTSLITKSCQ